VTQAAKRLKITPLLVPDSGGSEYETSHLFAVGREIDDWGPIIKKAGICAD